MTHKIIKTDNYLLVVSDEYIKDVRPFMGRWHLEDNQTLNKFPTYLTDLSACKLIIAHLPINGSPILEGVPTYVEYLADIHASKIDHPHISNHNLFEPCYESFIKGYQAAEKEKFDEVLTKYQEGMKKGLELSKELYTEYDVRKAIEMAREGYSSIYTEKEIIEQLKQSKL